MSEYPRGKEAREFCWCDCRDVDIPAKPFRKETKVSQIDLPGMRALPVGPKLAIEAADGGREFHGMSMNASAGKEVNSILRCGGVGARTATIYRRQPEHPADSARICPVWRRTREIGG